VRSNQQFDFSIPYGFAVLMLDRSIEELSSLWVTTVHVEKKKQIFVTLKNAKKCSGGGCREILLDALLFI
jgi:hypothetical protein